MVVVGLLLNITESFSLKYYETHALKILTVLKKITNHGSVTRITTSVDECWLLLVPSKETFMDGRIDSEKSKKSYKNSRWHIVEMFISF